MGRRAAGTRERAIPEVVIPAMHVAPVTVPDQYLAGSLVPGFSVGGVDLPPQVIPAQ